MTAIIYPGYHLTPITKGTLGEVSKIQEEFEEFLDATKQDNPLMQLQELSDMIGAIEAWLSNMHPTIGLEDLIKMHDATKRAFVNGHRK